MHRIFFVKYFLVLLALFASFSSFSQAAIKIRGQVVEEDNNEPLSYADILAKGATKGTLANDSGYFSLTFDAADFPVTLIVSYAGHNTKEVTFTRLRRNVTVKLEKRITELNEIVIRPSENPAHTILRKMVRRKKENNPENIASYTANLYRKTLWQLKNIDSALVDGNAALRSLKKSMVKQHDSVRRYTLPLLFSEEVSQEVFNLSPYYSYSIPVTERKSGISVLENANIFSEYANMFTEKVNFYNDAFLLNNTPVVNPVSTTALAFYNLNLIPDTVFDSETGLRLFHVKFSPKNRHDAAFEGEMVVYDSIFALKNISVELLPTSNVPFVIGYAAKADYMLVRDSAVARGYRPFVKNSDLNIDFHFLKFKDDKVHACAAIGISNRYGEVKTNPPFSAVKPDEEKMLAAKRISDDEMKLQRRDSLSVVEKEAMSSIVDLNQVGWISATNTAAVVLGSGYYNIGKIDIGPYAEMLKLNGAEGIRLNAPLRTSNSFHPNFFADGMVGYGTKDGKFKSVLDMGWKFNTTLRSALKVGGEYSSFRVGGNEAHFALLRENSLVLSEDLLWFSVFSVKLDDKYTTRYGGYIGYEREWSRRLLGTVTYSSYNIESSRYTPFTHNGLPVDVFTQQELSLRLRISSNKEKRSDFYARQYYLSNGNLPVISPVLSVGTYDLRGVSKYGYYAKLHLAVKQSFPLGTTMMRYAFEAGSIFGAVPFPLLEGHRSVESFMHASYKFNLLYNLALASDSYASLMMEYNLNGLILNRIPLIRKLNLKEMLSCKMLYSFMDKERHGAVLDMPDYLYTRNSAKPYIEVGGGIQNIFQLLGIGCVWRLPTGDSADVPYAYADFSVLVKFSFGN